MTLSASHAAFSDPNRGETTRERRMKFIEDFGRDSLKTGVTEMLACFGPDWLTDEQIKDIVVYKIDDWRRAMRNTIRNRAIQKTRISP